MNKEMCFAFCILMMWGSLPSFYSFVRSIDLSISCPSVVKEGKGSLNMVSFTDSLPPFLPTLLFLIV